MMKEMEANVVFHKGRIYKTRDLIFLFFSFFFSFSLLFLPFHLLFSFFYFLFLYPSFSSSSPSFPSPSSFFQHIFLACVTTPPPQPEENPFYTITNIIHTILDLYSSEASWTDVSHVPGLSCDGSRIQYLVGLPKAMSFS